MEPMNSWEVGYVMKLKDPSIPLGMSKGRIVDFIGEKRAKELDKWSEDGYNNKWLIEHSYVAR